MSFESITAAQRLAIRDSASKVATAAQKYVQTFETITAAEGAEVNPLLQPLANALQVAGISMPLAPTQAIVSNNQTLTVTGGTVKLTVANNVVTATYTPTP